MYLIKKDIFNKEFHRLFIKNINNQIYYYNSSYYNLYIDNNNDIKKEELFSTKNIFEYYYIYESNSDKYLILYASEANSSYLLIKNKLTSKNFKFKVNKHCLFLKIVNDNVLLLYNNEIICFITSIFVV